MPWPCSPAKASPESLSSTRRQRGSLTAVSAADDDLGEPHERGAGGVEQLGDGLLLVLDELLLEQDPLLEPAAEATLDDLVERGLGLALGPGDVDQGGPLLVDLGFGDLVTRGRSRAW